MFAWNKSVYVQKDVDNGAKSRKKVIVFVDSLICLLYPMRFSYMNGCSVAPHWHTQLVVNAPHNGGSWLQWYLSVLPHRGCGTKQGEGGGIDGGQNGKQLSEMMTEKTDSRHTQTTDTAWYPCVCVCAFMQMWKVRLLCVGCVCPRTGGTSLGFHRYSSPGTKADRQAEGETVNHKLFSAELLWPARSQGESYWSLCPSFSFCFWISSPRNALLTGRTPRETCCSQTRQSQIYQMLMGLW